MNLKGFKKTHEDEHSATLQNQRGHSIKLAKAQLSKSHCEALKKLPLYKAGGGGVETTDPRDMTESGTPDEQVAQPAMGDEPERMPANQTQSIQQPQTTEAPEQAQSPQDQYGNAYNAEMDNSAAERGKEDALWAQDLANGHIHPTTYADMFARKSTLGKIGTIFGVMLSGLGAGMAHQKNAALEMMQKELEIDLDAQKNSKTGAMNYFRASLEQAKTKAEVEHLMAQAGLTREQAEKYVIDNSYSKAMNKMRIVALHNLFETTNNLQPAQKANAQGGLNSAVAPAILQKNQQDNLSAEEQFQQRTNKLRSAELLGALPGGGAQANTEEAHHFPGMPELGQSSIALDKEDKNYLTSGQNFDKQLNAFSSWSKAHSGDLKPDDIKTGKALAAEVSSAYRGATNGGVYKEGEQNFIGQIIDPDPTKFFNSLRTLPQLDVVEKDNKRRLDTKIKSLWGPGKSYPGYKETKWMKGVEYEEGPNGKPVPVKR